MKKQKGTTSILETIRNKIHKIEKPSDVANNSQHHSDDDFEYIDASSKDIINSKKGSKTVDNSRLETPKTTENTSDNFGNKEDDDFDFLSIDKDDENANNSIANETSKISQDLAVPEALEVAKDDMLNIKADDSLDLEMTTDSQDRPIDLPIEPIKETKADNKLEELQKNTLDLNNKTDDLDDLETEAEPAFKKPVEIVENKSKEAHDDLDDLVEPDDLEEDLDDIESDEEEATTDEDSEDEDNQEKITDLEENSLVDIEDNLQETNNSQVTEQPKEEDEEEDEEEDLDELDLEDLEDKKLDIQVAEKPKLETKAELKPELQEEDLDLENIDLEEDEVKIEPIEIKQNQTPNIADKAVDEDEDLKNLDLEEEIKTPEPQQNIVPQPTKLNEPTQNNTAQPAKNNSMISENIAKQTTETIKELISSIPKKQQFLSTPSPAFRSGETIEEMVAGLLAPKLEQWLNENLPSMVEKIVKEEIKKLIPQD